MYQPAEERYEPMTYNRCGRSGLKLPAVSLGLWHNFGGVDRCETLGDAPPRLRPGRHPLRPGQQLRPAPGSAEETFGSILARICAPIATN